MTGPGKKRPPLVADRRYPAKPAAKKAAPKKTPAKKKPVAKRKAAPKKAKPRGFIGWVLAPFRWLFRLIWAFRSTLQANCRPWQS
jgi:penicillin-binding protein 1A